MRLAGCRSHLGRSNRQPGLGRGVPVAPTGLLLGHALRVAPTGLPLGHALRVAPTGLPLGHALRVALTGLPSDLALTGPRPRLKESAELSLSWV